MEHGPVDLLGRRARPTRSPGCTDEHRWLEMISAAADGELVADESRSLAHHLAACASCTSVLDSFEVARRRSRMRPALAASHLVGQVLDERSVQRTRSARTRTVAWTGGVAIFAALALLGALLLLPHGTRSSRASGPPPSSNSVVAVRDRSFDRSHLEVAAGTTVEWSNAGSTRHHLVRILGGATVDGELPPGATATARFEQPGTFEYYCSIHPGMDGSITVVA